MSNLATGAKGHITAPAGKVALRSVVLDGGTLKVGADTVGERGAAVLLGGDLLVTISLDADGNATVDFRPGHQPGAPLDDSGVLARVRYLPAKGKVRVKRKF